MADSPVQPVQGILSPGLSYLRSTLERDCRARAGVATHDGRAVLCSVLGGFPLWTWPDEPSVGRWLVRDGFWESWLTLAMACALWPGMRCVDVGANFGYYTVLMAASVGPPGAVLAIEPHPELADLIGRTLAANGFRHASVRACAVGHERGQGILHVPHNVGGASLRRLAIRDVREIPVPVEVLDDLLATWSAVDFVKIDAEGAELDVWRGMKRTIAKNPQIQLLMEIATNRDYDATAFVEEVIGRRFSVWIVDEEGGLRALNAKHRLRPGQLLNVWLRGPEAPHFRLHSPRVSSLYRIARRMRGVMKLALKRGERQL